MKILQEYVKKYLVRNNKRTALSISALILATSLLFTVFTIAYNTYQGINTSISQSTGNYHVVFYNVKNEFIRYVDQNMKVSNISKVSRLGLSQINSRNEDKPYINVQGYNEQAFDYLGIELLEGRFPENSEEIIISEQILNEAKIKYEINQQVELTLGKRIYHDETLDDYSRYHITEEFVPQRSSTYTIVGIYKNNLLDLNTASYSALTCYSQGEAISHDYYLTFKDPSKAHETINQFIEIFDGQYDSYSTNDRLLTYTNLFSSTYVDPFILIFLITLILTFLILTLLLIYHTFAFSYANREKHLAILKSVGVTERQMKMMVTYEGMIILLIALPLGIMVGLIFIHLCMNQINDLLTTISANRIQIHPDHILTFGFASIALVASSSLISIQIASVKASKRSISMTLRSSDEVPEDKSYLDLNNRNSNIINQLIKKGIRQNKKTYRIIVLFISAILTLLITFTSIMAYLSDSGIVDVNAHNYDVRVQITADEYPTPLMTRLKLIQPARSRLLSESIIVHTNDLEGFNQEYITKYVDVQESEIMIELIAYNDQILNEFIIKNNLLSEKEINRLYDKENKTGILINEIYNSTENHFYEIFDSDVLKEFKIHDDIYQNLNVIKSSELIMGLSNSDTIKILVSHDILQDIVSKSTIQPTHYYYAHYQTSEPETLARNLHTLVESEMVQDFDVINATASLHESRAISLLTQILFYSYLVAVSLMGLLVSLTIVSTNFEYREYEFILYRIIGLRLRDIRYMIFVELLYFNMKCLMYTVPLAMLINYICFMSYFEKTGIKYYIPHQLMIWIISISVILCFIGTIYATEKIRHKGMSKASKNEISLL